jgi:hypothetical protein
MKERVAMPVWALVAFTALAAPAAGCGRDRVALASLVEGGAEGQPCHADEDCLDAHQYCARSACDADAGTCTEIRDPATCGEPYDPRCGCDHVLYYNPCMLAAATKSSDLTGRSCVPSVCDGGFCGSPFCDGTHPCEAGKSCAFVFRVPPPYESYVANVCKVFQPGASNAPAFLGGNCWAVPPTCPDGGGAPFLSCNVTNSGRIDSCSAIKSGGVFVEELPAAP